MGVITEMDPATNGTVTEIEAAAAEVTMVTPQQAEAWLANNGANRRIRPMRVRLYAKMMAAGRWRLTGESIVLSPTGVLMNGQHRLLACVEAGVPFPTVVVRGVEPEAMRVMDSGFARTAADTFRLEGISHSAGSAAAIRNILLVKGGAGVQQESSRKLLITRDELIEFHAAHLDAFAPASALGSAAYAALRHSYTGWVTLAYLIGEVDQETAIDFFGGLITGAELEKGDPRLALRTWVTNALGYRRRLTANEITASGIKAWNAWIANESLSKLQGWRPSQRWPAVRSA